jgi:hypothetical protein
MAGASRRRGVGWWGVSPYKVHLLATTVVYSCRDLLFDFTYYYIYLQRNTQMALPVPENPFQRLITACNDSSVLAALLNTLKDRINYIQAQLQGHYEAHRSARNAQYRARILSPDFPGWQVDEILKRLHESSSEGDAPLIDTRNNLSFWARPPRHIRDLIAGIQEDIRTVAPS